MGSIFTFVLAIIVVAFAYKLALQWMSRRDQRQYDPDEARMIQELHHGFTRLEERIETLETILLEQREKNKTEQKS